MWVHVKSPFGGLGLVFLFHVLCLLHFIVDIFKLLPIRLLVFNPVTHFLRSHNKKFPIVATSIVSTSLHPLALSACIFCTGLSLWPATLPPLADPPCDVTAACSRHWQQVHLISEYSLGLLFSAGRHLWVASDWRRDGWVQQRNALHMQPFHCLLNGCCWQVSPIFLEAFYFLFIIATYASSWNIIWSVTRLRTERGVLDFRKRSEATLEWHDQHKSHVGEVIWATICQHLPKWNTFTKRGFIKMFALMTCWNYRSLN